MVKFSRQLYTFLYQIDDTLKILFLIENDYDYHENSEGISCWYIEVYSHHFLIPNACECLLEKMSTAFFKMSRSRFCFFRFLTKSQQLLWD